MAGRKQENRRQGAPILRKASDETVHAFPHGTPETDIEKYLWRYENGQTLPAVAFSPAYKKARACYGKAVHRPENGDDDAPARRNVRITARRGPALPPKPARQTIPEKADPQNWSWNIAQGDHDYQTQKNLICPAEWDCSEEMVGKIYSQQRNGILGHAGEGQIESGKSYIVPYGALGRAVNPYLPEWAQIGGRINSYVGKDGLTVNNVTDPHGRHIFHSGWANRNATQDKKGNWYSQTHGKGTNYVGGGLMAAVNTTIGPGAFDDLDHAIRDRLYQETHRKKR